VVEDGDILVVTSDHGFVELDREGGRDLGAAGGEVKWRYVAGARVNGQPYVDLGEEGTYSLAVGREWFRRPGGTWTRYSHGGISFDELLVPGAVLRHSGAPRLELRWNPAALELRGVEREPVRGTAELVNAGNRAVQFRLACADDRLRLSPQEGNLSARDRVTLVVEAELPPGRYTAEVSGSYGMERASGDMLPTLALGITVDDAPGKVEIDFSALDLFDEE
jgi:hypothetical protein